MSLALALAFAILMGIGGVQFALGVSGGIDHLSERPPRQSWRAIRSLGVVIVFGTGGIVAGFIFGYGIGQAVPTKVIAYTTLALIVGVMAKYCWHHGTDALH
jgi:hypothetical protein